VFSETDLRDDAHPSISVTTRVHDTRATALQSAAWITAALAAFASLILVGLDRRRPTGRRVVRTSVRDTFARIGRIDVFVGVALATWWIIGPAFFDDGWALARQRSLSTSGGFSNYFEPYGASLPLGYWHDWALHWIAEATDDLAWQRLPALACLAATWVLLRYGRALTSNGRSNVAAVDWALAVAFVTVVMAWGMSLRQESAVALLLATTIVCTARFVSTNSPASLALAAAVVPLALTAHPAGVVATAPLLAAAPTIYRWVRAAPASAVALFVSSAALTVALGFVGSDVEQRAIDANAISHGATTGSVGWRNELIRYSVVVLPRVDDLTGYGAPLRRASVALMLLAALSALAFSRRIRTPTRAIAMYTLPISLVLLVLTPSKWPWHFGALIAPIALAVAGVTTILRDQSERETSWRVRPLIGIAVLTMVIGWSWSPRAPWNSLDLRTLDWTPELEAWIPLSAIAVVTPIALLLGAVVLARIRHVGSFRAPWQVVIWSAPLLTVPLIAFTATVFVADAIRTPGWTHSSTNLTGLWGSAGCGLAEDLFIPSPRSFEPVPIVADTRPNNPRWVPPSPTPGLQRYALGPVRGGSAATPWFSMVDSPMAIFVNGELGPSDRLFFESGRRERGRVHNLGSTQFRIRRVAEGGASIPWRLVPVEVRAEQATVVRVTLVNTGAPSGAVAVSAPVTYRTEPLSRRLRAAATLALPNVATFVPCADQPALHHGVVDVPTTIVTARDADAPVRYPGTTPFAGLLDLYAVAPLPLTLQEGRPDGIVAFEVDARIPGVIAASPDQQTTVD
jgi:arabinosyltransferase C